MNKRTKIRNQGIESDFQAAVQAAEEEATIGRWAWPSLSVPLEPGASSFVLENVIARMLVYLETRVELSVSCKPSVTRCTWGHNREPRDSRSRADIALVPVSPRAVDPVIWTW